MEHVIITNLGGGMVRLVPETGYRLFEERTGRTYSEAVVKEEDKRFFYAEAV